MALQVKSQMKITLNWIIVNLTEFLFITRVFLQHGLSFGLSPEFFRPLFFILCFSLDGLLAHSAPPLLMENQSEKKKVFFLSGKGGYPPPP